MVGDVRCGLLGRQTSHRWQRRIDAVEKVRGIPLERNNRIIRVYFLNRTCAFHVILNQCCAEILQKSFFDSIGHFQTNRRLHRCPSIGPRHGAGVVRQRLRLLGQRMALPLWCRMFANKHLNSTAKIDAVDELRQRDDVHGRCNRGNSRGPLGG